MQLQVIPVEWSITYPVNPHDPIGHIRRERDGFSAWLLDEDLGVHASEDDAAAAVWERYLRARTGRARHRVTHARQRRAQRASLAAIGVRRDPRHGVRLQRTLALH